MYVHMQHDQVCRVRDGCRVSVTYRIEISGSISMYVKSRSDLELSLTLRPPTRSPVKRSSRAEWLSFQDAATSALTGAVNSFRPDCDAAHHLIAHQTTRMHVVRRLDRRAASAVRERHHDHDQPAAHATSMMMGGVVAVACGRDRGARCRELSSLVDTNLVRRVLRRKADPGSVSFGRRALLCEDASTVRS